MESLDALTFVARRLGADPVVMLFATRDESPHLSFAGLPLLSVSGQTKTISRLYCSTIAISRSTDPRS